MIAKTKVLLTRSTDPHVNLAVEDALLRSLGEQTAILYLWQNKHTVVIGSGQNAWGECHTQLLEREGGTLARRSSGGGAVYHDLGNLNFSFIVPREDYAVERQLAVVLDAVRLVGIDAEASGRNDLTANGRKFSGNAFRLLKDSALHHGTLLVDVDMAMLPRYLNVAPDKLKAKGVKSVPSRVINLSALADVTIDHMKDAMIQAFMQHYGACETEWVEQTPIAGLDGYLQKYRSWDWIYGASPEGEMRLGTRFAWGGVELIASVKGGVATGLVIYTDAMDETLKARLEAALANCPWRAEALFEAASAAGEPDVAEWLARECRHGPLPTG